MGIIIDSGQFEVVNIMKDLEIARHSLDKVKLHEIKNPNDGIVPDNEVKEDHILTLEWLQEDEEAEEFTLVESRKKKKMRTQLENLARDPILRRRNRITPSIYRKSRDQENSGALRVRPLHTKKGK
jgi:hypothetical protein